MGQEDSTYGQPTPAHARADHPQAASRRAADCDGATTADAAKQIEVSEPTFHRWRNRYGGMKADDVKRLKELERENARLKKIVADQALDIDALREVAKGNW